MLDKIKTLNVTLLSPRETLFEGPALSVSSVNSTGPFDILPEHANFITLVEKHPVVVVTPDNQSKSYNFSEAIIYITEDKVLIYAEPQIDLSHAPESTT